MNGSRYRSLAGVNSCWTDIRTSGSSGGTDCSCKWVAGCIADVVDCAGPSFDGQYFVDSMDLSSHSL